ncbi:MAG: 50S ribosomal protein L2 [Patescibacteria group bacterium]|nr:50S ribosomal protein L2 [Patescibacteria group bacterium]
MAIKKYKPITPSLRTLRTIDYSELSKSRPVKGLTVSLKKTGGRNNQGKITMRGRGQGHKRLYRIIDHSRKEKFGVPATVKTLEYDPNRTAFIALLVYADGDKRYMIAPDALAVGDKVICAEKASIKPGNRIPLKSIPVGQLIHEVEVVLGEKNTVVRSAGTSAVLTSLDGEYAQVKLPSGEVRYVSKESFATLGQVSNGDHSLTCLGKAGRKRWLGKKGKVGGSQKNPVDHPHGGGEGHQPVGIRKGPKTPWGRPALGVKTRRNKVSDHFIARTRARSKK